MLINKQLENIMKCKEKDSYHLLSHFSDSITDNILMFFSSDLLYVYIII